MKSFLCSTGEIKEAIEIPSGSKCYLKNNKLHKIDGPAIVHLDGSAEWWYEGQQLNCRSQDEFERYLKLIAFW